MPAPTRSPRYLRFLVTGALLGIVAAALITVVRGDAVEAPGTLMAYLGLLLSALGALAGGGIAVLLEARQRR